MVAGALRATARRLDSISPSVVTAVSSSPSYRARLGEYYDRTLSSDLLYATYSHAAHAHMPARPDPATRSPVWSPENPYALNRRAPPRPKGNRYLAPNPTYRDAQSVVRLHEVVVSTMTRAAVTNKGNLTPVLMALQAITGEPPAVKQPGPYGPGTAQGLQVTRSTRKSSSFKIRAGFPTGVKVSLRGPAMYTFLETLVDVVLPRFKSFNGVLLPAPTSPRQSGAAMAGVVSFGLPPEAMGLFPEIEANSDQYPRLFGFNVQCITTARGRGAQDQARALLSGFNLPFIRR